MSKLKPSISTHSEPCTRHRMRLLRYFALDHSVFKTKHLRRLLGSLVRGFEWLWNTQTGNTRLQNASLCRTAERQGFSSVMHGPSSILGARENNDVYTYNRDCQSYSQDQGYYFFDPSYAFWTDWKDIIVVGLELLDRGNLQIRWVNHIHTCGLAWPDFWCAQLHNPPNGDFCPRIGAS